MNNALVALQNNAPVLVDDEETRAIANSIAGGLTGGSGFGNRLSLLGNRFHFIKNGVDVGTIKTEHLDVVMIAANPHVSRIYFAGQYDPNVKAAPDCYSIDGKVPEADSPQRQSDKCMTCPQNVKGSAVRGNNKAKACAYKKRVIVVAPDAIDSDMFALDVNALSLFGDDRPAQNLYNLKSYIETLAAHQMMAVKLVTRLTFDDQSSVPKLFFSPINMLTPEQWEMVKSRIKDDAIQQMLSDVINENEVGTVNPEAVKAPSQLAPNQAPANPVAARATPSSPDPTVQPEAPKTRGRPRGTTAQPTNGNGAANTAAAANAMTQAVRGFAPSAEASSAASEAGPKKGFQIDLENFDD